MGQVTRKMFPFDDVIMIFTINWHLVIIALIGPVVQLKLHRYILHELLFAMYVTESVYCLNSLSSETCYYDYDCILLQISQVITMLLLRQWLLFFYASICFGIDFSSATNSTVTSMERRGDIHILQTYVKGKLPQQTLLDVGITTIPAQVFTSFSALTVRYLYKCLYV